MLIRTMLSATALCLASFAANAAVPNMVGTWVTNEDFVNTGSNAPVPGWPSYKGPTTTVQPRPSVVVTQQKDRQVIGYMVTPTGHVPFHAILKHSGTGLIGRNPNGILTADLDGDNMEWCFASTAPKDDIVACNTFHRQATK